ncbi:hypothetical protein [Deminuibacter soli]|uniref:Uncharacterized protein n=1 Tax=Deminuibacter soli TaxID=2291815 RepID=A0A3E1NG87_9BACT|nr:hypothetical protein [Deminuibacter soli]RFM26980.1 hypothetical protein DXN05_15985 [Deminuibacter soli]
MATVEPIHPGGAGKEGGNANSQSGHLTSAIPGKSPDNTPPLPLPERKPELDEDVYDEEDNWDRPALQGDDFDYE